VPYQGSGGAASGSQGPHQTKSLPVSEHDDGIAGVSASVRFLLQGMLLQRRQRVLYHEFGAGADSNR
ncbi:MAG: hypothetical protein OQJ89_00900, partial [Kangiellaceae bacterium]|nr:hypothetical protein [Kangiellaceae bacterium]